MRAVQEPDLSIDPVSLSVINQLARSRSGEEARRLARMLRTERCWLAPAFLTLVDSLEERAIALEQQCRLAGRDELTGVGNRRTYNEALRREVARAQRSNKALSLLMLDVDGLKQINDVHGHPIGDLSIQAVANAALAAVRDGDEVFRLGGDEFAVLLPDAQGNEAAVVGERIRRKLREHPVPEVKIEVSFGHDRLRPDDRDEQVLMANADRALYRNKRARRA